MKMIRFNFGWRIICGALLTLFSALAFTDSEIQDPTRPSTYIKVDATQNGLTELNLQAVFMRESGNQAVINGALVQVGDEVANLPIRSISANRVQLGSGSNMRELFLRPSVLTTPKLGE